MPCQGCDIHRSLHAVYLAEELTNIIKGVAAVASDYGSDPIVDIVVGRWPFKDPGFYMCMYIDEAW